MSQVLTLAVLIGGLSLLLVGVGLFGTLIGVRGGEAGFSGQALGLIMSGYYLGYVAGTFLVPRVIHGVGHIRTFTAFAAFTAAIVLLTGMVVDPWAWGVFRVLSGVGVVAVYMVVESWINEQTPSERRGLVFGAYTSVTLAALGGSQYLLLLASAEFLMPFALAAIFVALGIIPVAITRVRAPGEVTVPEVAFGRLYRISPLAFQGALLSGMANSAFWGMTAVFGYRLGLDSAGIALLISATIFGGAALQWPIGHLSDRYDRRRVLIVVSALCAMTALASLAVLERGAVVLAAVGFLYGGLMFPLYSLSVAHANDHVAASEVLEATRGLLLVYGVGAIIGPAAVGVGLGWFGPVALPIFSALCLFVLAVFGVYRVTRRPPPVEVEDQTEFIAMVRTTTAVLDMLPAADEALPEERPLQTADDGQAGNGAGERI